MPLELFTNAANPTTARATTLGAAMLAGDLTLTVASSTGFPAAVAGVSQFRVLIESEIVLVTNVAGLVWTIVRGQEGTTAAAHALSVAVSATITAAALANTKASFWQAGYVVGSFIHAGRTGTNMSIRTHGAGEILYCPIQVFAPVTVDALRLYTNSVAGGLIRLALYDSNGLRGEPGRLLTESADVSTAGAASDKTILVTATTLAAGWYWTALIVNAATQVSAHPAGTMQPFLGISPANGGDARTTFLTTQAFGAFPATAAQGLVFSEAAGIFLRVA